MADIGEQLGRLLGTYAGGEGVRVSIKTDLGPELQVYDADAPGGDSSGPLAWLTPKAAIIVRSRKGGEIATFGNYPDTNPAKVAAVVIPLAILAALVVRGLAKR